VQIPVPSWVLCSDHLPGSVRTLLDFFAAIPDSEEVQTKVLRDNIDWAKREKRIFLKQSLETRLIALWVSCVFFYARLFL
jgi:26S proteasome regulatory subunit N6